MPKRSSKYSVLAPTFLILATVAGCSGGLKDLRPERLASDGPTAQEQTRGRELLDRASALTGGRELWNRVDTIEVNVLDEWDNLMAELAFLPYDKNQEFDLWVKNPGLNNVRMTLLNGSQAGEVWGFEKGVAYQVIDGARRADDNRFAVLFVKSAAALIALPIRLPMLTKSPTSMRSTFKARVTIASLSLGADESAGEI